MKKILFVLSFICICQIVDAQQWAQYIGLQKQLRISGQDTGRINILLKMAEFEILKTGEFKADLDSAAGYIHDAEQINDRVRSREATGYITIEKAHLAREHKDMATGKALMETAIKQLTGTGNKYLLGTAYLGLSDYYEIPKPDEQPKKQLYVQTAANIFKSGGYIEREAFCDRNLTEIMTDDAAAMKKLNEAFALYKSINYKKLQDVYDLYAEYYLIQSDFKRALNYELTALRTAEDQDDHSGTLCEIENHLGIIYSHLGDNANQFRFFKMAIVVAKANGDIPTVVLLTLNVANAYLTLNQPLQAKELLTSLSKYDVSHASAENMTTFYRSELKAYDILSDYGEAAKVSTELIKSLKSDGLWQQTRGDSYVELITYYLDTKQYPDARKYLLMNDILIKKLSAPINLHASNVLWFRLDTGMHDYKSAVYHSILEKNLADTINKINGYHDIQQLQVKFDTKEKESEISLLQQKSLFETQKLRQAGIVKNYTFGGIALLLMIAGLLYRQNLLKQRSSNIISNKNKLLQQLVDEKEWLVKEIHHRVKNNLHTIICLLESQAAYLENDALKAIENSQHRIYAMSLIHQKLYQSDDIKVIDMSLYLVEFIRYLEESFGSPRHIKVILEAENIKLGAGQAIPTGLIINEAVNNSYKYAFPNERAGEIAITIKKIGDDILLSIKDNGTGFKHKDDQETNSLGLELIKGLAQDLRGELKFDTENGTSIQIRFKIDYVGVPANEENILALT